MKKKKSSTHLDTNIIVEGNYSDLETGSVTPPIYMTSTFQQQLPGQHKGYAYARTKNPTRERLHEVYAAIENAKYAISVGSGLAAETVILQSLPPASHILSPNDLYGGTYRLFSKVFHQTHQFSYEDFSDLKVIEQRLKEKKITDIWMETPTNPLLHIIDIKQISQLAKKYKVKVIVDNTFATPCGQQPLNLGADVVIHSATKYLNGHSDLIAGAIMLNDKVWYEKLFFFQNAMGTTQSGMDSWLILRGLKTLSVRMERHEKNALALAKYLETHPKVREVIYPGLPSHPQHSLVRKQMNNFGGMISFRLKNEKKVLPFLGKLHVFHLAESLGGVESLVCHPTTMTHASIPLDIKTQQGITHNLIRLSVGIEHIDDIQQDIEDAMKIV